MLASFLQTSINLFNRRRFFVVCPFDNVGILLKDDIILVAALTSPMAFGNSCSLQLVNFAEGSPLRVS